MFAFIRVWKTYFNYLKTICFSVLHFNQNYFILDEGIDDVISDEKNEKVQIESTPLGDKCDRIVLENGTATYTNITDHITIGTKVNFRCKRGIAVKGPNSALCKANGQWSNILPQCGNYNIKACSNSKQFKKISPSNNL